MRPNPTVRASTLVYVERLCLQAQRLRSIPRLSVAAHGDPERLMSAVCSVTPSLLRADGVAVFVDDSHGALRIRAAAGFPDRFTRWARLPPAEMTAAVDRDGPVVRMEGLQSLWPCPETLLQCGSRTALWAPIRQRGRTLGGLFAGRADATTLFTDDDCLYAEVLAEYLAARLGELTMSRRLERLQRALVRSARLATIGELAASVARGIAGSMEEVAGLAERAAAALGPGPAREGSEQIRREARGTERLARALSRFGASGVEEPRTMAVDEVLSAAAALAGRQLEADGIQLELGWDEELPALTGRPSEIGQALLQLVANARHALNRRFPQPHDDKRLRLGARQVEGTIEIEVWDGGCGMSSELIVRLSEPLFTTHGRAGVGLGLAVCREVVKAQGGALRIESEEGHWSRFVMVLPLGREERT